MSSYSDFVESLKRLRDNPIIRKKINQLYSEDKLTKEEYDYILS